LFISTNFVYIQSSTFLPVIARLLKTTEAIW